MDTFDRRIRERLLVMPPDWETRAAGMREEVQAMYEERIKKAATWTWIGSGIGLLLLLSGLPAIALGVILGNASVTVVGAMMFLFGDAWIGMSKLLYWVWNSRIRLERDIKEVHADLLEVLTRIERLETAVAGKKGQEGE